MDTETVAWRQEMPVYSCIVPKDMVNGPHMVHFAGVLMQPGKHNDYTIEFVEDNAIIHWWDEAVVGYGEKLISVTDLKTGSRWAYSSEDGVYVDTRRRGE